MPITRQAAVEGASASPKLVSPKSTSKTKGKHTANADSSPLPKRAKTEVAEKDQKTIEETMQDAEPSGNGHEAETDTANEKMKQNREHGYKTDGEQNGSNDVGEDAEKSGPKGEKGDLEKVKADESEVKEAADKEETEKVDEIAKDTDFVVQDTEREAAIPSSILEKGIIYFFFRGRVNIEDPKGVKDVARSYIVLRPLPIGAKLGEGPLEDSGNARLLALPKKSLPKSKRDRFLVFVENPKASVKELKENFIAASDHATKTVGISHTPAATPVAEGIYSITSTGRESHLAYHITIPHPLGDVQKDLGLEDQGSYVLSVKNPTTPAPANVSLSQGASYPENIMTKFRGLRWMPLEPELLDYKNTQFLIIGEGLGNVDKAMEEQEVDEKDVEKETPAEEMEKLEDEDHLRIEHLKGDDPIFADLGLSSKSYSKIQTTW